MSKRSQPSNGGAGAAKSNRSRNSKVAELKQGLTEPAKISTLLLDEGALTPYRLDPMLWITRKPHPIQPTSKAVTRSADYTYWRSLDLWTLVEAAFLLAQLEPQRIKKIDDDGSPQGKYYRRIKDAVTLGKIPKHDSRTGHIGGTLIRPKTCVAWAKKSGISVPSELADLSDNVDNHELDGKGRTSALRLIIGMAVACYDYDPDTGKSTVPAAITKDLDTLGIGVTAETVKKWLDEAAPLLPRRKTTGK